MPVKKQIIKKTAMAPTALIAGGAGYLGSNLAETLLLKDARVIAIDNFKSGKKNYVDKLLSNPKFALYDADISAGIPDEIESVDYVFHLAALEPHTYSDEKVDFETLITNALGTKNLLDLTLKSQAKFLLASSLNVYHGAISPQSLDQYFGQSPSEEKEYSVNEAKRFAEALVWEFYKKNSSDVRIVRLPEIYGPKMNFEACGNFGLMFKDLIANKDITVVGEGEDKEFYLYITDAVSGLVKALFNKGTTGKIYSLVTKEPYTMLEVAYVLKSIASGDVRLAFKPKPKTFGFFDFHSPDTETLTGLRWEPKVPLKEGSAKTLNAAGYAVNEHSFKPAKLIEDKRKSKVSVETITAQNTTTPLDTTLPIPLSESAGVSTPTMTPTAIPAPLTSIPANTVTTDPTVTTAPTVPTVPPLASTDTITSLADWGVPAETPMPAEAPKFAETSKTTATPDPIKTPNPPEAPTVLVQKNIEQNLAPVPAEIKPIIDNPKFEPKSALRLRFRLPVLKFMPKLQVGTNKAFLLLGILGVLFSFLVIFVGIPTGTAYINAKAGVDDLQKIPSLISQLDTSSKDTAKTAFEHFDSAKTSFSKLAWVFKLSGSTSKFNTILSTLASAKYFSKAIYNVSKATNPFNSAWDVLRPTNDQYLNPEDFDKAKIDISIAMSDLQLAQAEYKNIDSEQIPFGYGSKVLEFGKLLGIASEGLTVANSSLASIPDLMGLTKPKKYLVLFQNSNELRPTGGFIGSYAILELDRGKIANLTIDDIYNPDGQIDVRKIKVPAPKPIQDLLKESDLHIRNANWDPSFPESAREIENLFFKVTGQRFDGIIGVNLGFVKALLNVTGPVFLTAYSEEITAENLYERTQFHSEFNYKDGSDQKKSFLTVLGSKLLEKVFGLSKEKLPSLFNEVQKALHVRDILIYLPNNQLASLLEKNNFDGAIRKTDGDYLYVVDANLGGTKANYYVDKEMNYSINSVTRDGLLRAELTLTYTHRGTDRAWPGGPYVDYVRVLTQKGTKLTGAKFIDAKEVEKDITKEIIISDIDGLPSYETTFTLDPGTKVTLKIQYDLPEQFIITMDNKKYNLLWQRQSGTPYEKLHFDFTAPFGIKPEVYNSDLKLEGDKVIMDSVMDSDKELYLGLK